jgi:hypothetical protein
MKQSKRPRQSSESSSKLRDRISKATAAALYKLDVEWNKDMIDEDQMLNLLLEIPVRENRLSSQGKPPSSYIIDDTEVIAVMGKGCDLFNFLMFELVTFLFSSTGFFQSKTSTDDSAIMKALEYLVVQRFSVSKMYIFDAWRKSKGFLWSRHVKDTKRNLLDHWTNIALKPSFEYTQDAVIGFTASIFERARFLDNKQSFLCLPRVWVGHESSIDENTTTGVEIFWKPLPSNEYGPGPLKVLIDSLRELERIDEDIATIITKYSEVCKTHNLEIFDTRSFLEDDSRLNVSYCDAINFFKLQLETIGKVGFVSKCQTIGKVANLAYQF